MSLPPPPDSFKASIFSQTPLILKSYFLYREILKLTKDFPKVYRYGLGEKSQNAILSIIEITSQALYSRQPLKEPLILKLIGIIQTLQLFIRLAYDEELISERNFFTLSDQVIELNKMAAGWLTSVRSPSQPKVEPSPRNGSRCSNSHPHHPCSS